MGEDGRPSGCQDNETRIRQNRCADRHRQPRGRRVPLAAPLAAETTRHAPATGRRRSITIAARSQADPNNAEYRIAYERAMISASQVHLDAARVAEARGQLEDALREYRRASEFDPPNRQIAAKVTDLERMMRDQIEASRPRNSVAQMREQARQSGPPPLFNLNTVMAPIRFNQASLRDIFCVDRARPPASTSRSTARSRIASTRWS